MPCVVAAPAARPGAGGARARLVVCAPLTKLLCCYQVPSLSICSPMSTLVRGFVCTLVNSSEMLVVCLRRQIRAGRTARGGARPNSCGSGVRSAGGAGAGLPVPEAGYDRTRSLFRWLFLWLSLSLSVTLLWLSLSLSLPLSLCFSVSLSRSLARSLSLSLFLSQRPSTCSSTRSTRAASA